MINISYRIEDWTSHFGEASYEPVTTFANVGIHNYTFMITNCEIGTIYEEYLSNNSKNYEVRYPLSSVKGVGVEFINMIKTGVGSVGFKNDASSKYWIYNNEYKKSLKDGEKCTIQGLKKWLQDKPQRTEEVRNFEQSFVRDIETDEVLDSNEQWVGEFSDENEEEKKTEQTSTTTTTTTNTTTTNTTTRYKSKY